MHQWVQTRARLRPDAVAALFEDESLTRGQLERLADRLARRLIADGMGPGCRVALFLPRGFELVVAILAVMKSGAAYVPLDPDYPPGRLRHMLQDAAPDTVLVHQTLRAALPVVPGLSGPAQVVDLTELSLRAEGEMVADRHGALGAAEAAPETEADLEPIARGLTPAHVACIIYTSGSTGQPKGVMLHHAGLGNLLGVQAALFALDEDSRVLQFSSPSFDASLLDLSMALCHGATLCLAPRAAMLPGDPLVHTLQRHAVTHVTLPPSALAVLGPEVSFPSVKTVVVAGEVCPPAVTRRWASRHRLVNIYGPTETSVFVTAEVCAAEYPGSTPIGRPIANVPMYILDARLQPVPAGERGELHVGGVAVSHGYLGRPELTAERFIADPFSTEPGARLYKTGDVVRQGPGGSLEYIGRADHQVKLRGFRIELGEIETRLAACPGVREATVLCREDAPGHKRLVAYLTPSRGEIGNGSSDQHGIGAVPTIQALRLQLQAFLPEHMLPSAWVWMRRFPLTPNGKTDRAALPVPSAEAFETAAFEAPQGALEQALAIIWQDVLQVARVGRGDHFFALGGHSLRATQLAARVQSRLQVPLPLQLVFERPRLRDLAQSLAAAIGHRAGSLDAANAVHAVHAVHADEVAAIEATERVGAACPHASPAPAVSSATNVIPRLPRTGPLPCSHSQRRMWLVQQLTPQTTAYHVAFAFRLRGALDATALAAALDAVAGRHEAFRTHFELVDHEPMQLIGTHRPVPLAQLDLTSIAPDRCIEDARLALGDFTVQPFDLARAPLHRTLLVRLGEAEHVLLWVIHHAVCDLWSGGLLVRELFQAYAALREGRVPLGSAPAIEYADFADWQRRRAADAESARGYAYWQARLAGLRPLSLPTDLPRSGPLSGRGGTVQADLPASLLETLRQCSHRCGSTPFMTLLACFMVMLARRSGQQDLAVGVPIANRRQLESESLVGTLVNTLVMRNDLSGNPSFTTLLRQVRNGALEAYAHQDTPFEELVERCAAQRDRLHSPLVQVMFNVLNAPFDVSGCDGLEVQDFPFDQRAAQFDLSLSVDTHVFPQVQLDYSTDLFTPATARRLLDGYMALLDQVLADPERAIGDYGLLGAAEQAQLRRWNGTAVQLPALHDAGACVHERVAEGARRWPTRLAIDDGHASMTHAQLHAAAAHFAAALRRRGIGRGQRVGLCVQRSTAMVVAQLGILRAGAAYVPLDPGYPAERLRHMAHDAQLRLLVTDAASADALAWPNEQCMMLAADERLHAARADSADAWVGAAPEPTPQPTPETTGDAALDARGEDAAYVIYTSGSSGKPKGVVVPHRAVVNFLNSMAAVPGLAAGDRLLAVTTLSFDIAALELLLPLCVGAQVLLASPDEARDGRLLRARLERTQSSVMQATPATWQMLIDAGWRGGAHFKALVGGESLTPELARALQQRSAAVWNLYGPTETTVWSTCWAVAGPESPIRIGTPIANTRIHVLDERLRPCPIGVPGEICIAGDGVASGYLNLPELSAERFVPEPGRERQGGRLYRTGDRGRWCHDGLLQHLGRTDFQLKLRGHRIEPGEIEANLRTHPLVAQCVVVAREDTPGDLRLVAYAVADSEAPAPPPIAELREHLRRHVPDYMVPRHYVLLDTLPVLPNGKLDRAALPRPGDSAVLHDSTFWVPRTDAQVAIAQVWQALLGIERISLSDNFFDLGGHSLMAIRAVNEIEVKVGVKLSLRRLVFETLEQLAAGLDPVVAAAAANAANSLPDASRPTLGAAPAPTPMRSESTARYLVSGLQRMLLSRGARQKN